VIYLAESKVVQVNIWKELRKEINKTIGELSGLVLLTHNSVEFSDIVDFLNKVKRDESLKVMYISLINSYKKIKETLKEKPLANKNLFVVDCVSGFLIEIQDTVDCIYRKPPSNLEGTKDIIKKNLQLVSPNMIVIDSLSQFVNFSSPADADLQNLYKFLQTIKEDAMGITNDTVILLYDDKSGAMKKLPSMFTNTILKLEVIKEEVEWQD